MDFDFSGPVMAAVGAVQMPDYGFPTIPLDPDQIGDDSTLLGTDSGATINLQAAVNTPVY